MHGMLDRVTVGGPGAAPVAERRETENEIILDPDQNGIAARLARIEPFGAIAEGRRRDGVDRRRGRDHVVIDGEDLRDVLCRCVADEHRQYYTKNGATASLVRVKSSRALIVSASAQKAGRPSGIRWNACLSIVKIAIWGAP